MQAASLPECVTTTEYCQPFLSSFTLILPLKCRLLNCSSATNVKVLQSHSRLLKILSECIIAWIWMRLRVTRHLIWIQAVCIWHLSCDWRAKG